MSVTTPPKTQTQKSRDIYWTYSLLFKLMRMAAACLVQSRIDSLVHYSLSDLTKKNDAFLKAFFFDLYQLQLQTNICQLVFIVPKNCFFTEAILLSMYS